MGAIWDFISGKSTDWDAVNRQQEAYERTRPKKIYYKAYCKICGAYDRNFHSSKAEAVRRLQSEYMISTVSGGCGSGNHIPEVEAVEG